MTTKLTEPLITTVTALMRAERDEAQGSALECMAFQILNDEDQAFAGEILRDIKTKQKELEQKRKSVTGPLNQALRAVNRLFAPVKAKLDQCEDIIKKKITGYLEQKRQQNEIALQRAAEAEDRETAQLELANIEPTSLPKGVSVSHRWVPRVVDVSKVPREFLVVDMKLIRAWAKEHKQENGEPEPILGVVFEQKATVSARTS